MCKRGIKCNSDIRFFLLIQHVNGSTYKGKIVLFSPVSGNSESSRVEAQTLDEGDGQHSPEWHEPF